MTRIIYKISPQEAWEKAVEQGIYPGSADDLRDGFIHFSCRQQVEQTLAKHFKGQDSLLLISVDANKLGAALQWERSREDEIFPHLYGPLDLTAVLHSVPIMLDEDGTHYFPEPTE